MVLLILHRSPWQFNLESLHRLAPMLLYLVLQTAQSTPNSPLAGPR